MALISAIIPAYNGATCCLDQTLQSMVSQSFRDLEIIVVDDASTDDTARLVLHFPQASFVRMDVNGGQAGVLQSNPPLGYPDAAIVRPPYRVAPAIRAAT